MLEYVPLLFSVDPKASPFMSFVLNSIPLNTGFSAPVVVINKSGYKFMDHVLPDLLNDVILYTFGWLDSLNRSPGFGVPVRSPFVSIVILEPFCPAGILTRLVLPLTLKASYWGNITSI
ncbi:hypothetical protein [Escherichia phage IME178]|uniref:Uncharacterized protein n=1 Tax=Escherichia phage IME178 TaxID=2860371 RepID=A0AC61NLL8_9CAUD|nr:hypothetical protein [Escherichia phage IME178]